MRARNCKICGDPLELPSKCEKCGRRINVLGRPREVCRKPECNQRRNTLRNKAIHEWKKQHGR